MKTEARPNHGSVLPVDRGWAWLIVLGTMGHVLVMQTMIRSTAILFVEFMKKYDVSTGATSFIPSMQIFFQFFLSPITNALSVKFGSRAVVMVGSSALCIGCVSSAFASSIWQLYFSFGILVGFGFSCLFAPSFMLIAQYFHTRRALANGLAGIGAGIGIFTAPIVVRYLVDEYGLQGSLLILGAMTLNSFVFGSLFRPPSFYRNVSGHSEPSSSNISSNSETKSLMGKKILEIKIEELSSESSKDDNNPIRVRSNTMPEKDYREQSLPLVVAGDKQQENVPVNKNLLKVNQTNYFYQNLVSKSHETGLSFTKKHQTSLNPNSSRSVHNEFSSLASTFAMSTGELFLPAFEETGADDVCKDNDNNNRCCSNIFVVRTKDPTTGKYSQGTPLFQWHLFKNPVFVLYLATDFFGIFAVPLAYTFVAAYSDQTGIPADQIALLMAISGLPELFVRILIGVLVDCGFCSVLYFKLFILIGLVIECFAFPFCTQFGSILTITFLATGLNGMHFTLIPIAATELMGIHNLSTTMGFSMLVQSVGFGFSPLLAGFARDLSGGWFWPFFIGGSFGCIAVILLITILVIQKRKVKNSEEIVAVR